MKYQVKFEGSFNTEEESLAFCNLVEGLKSKLFKDEQIKDDVFHLSRTFQLFKAYHDEIPPKQCHLYKTIDFDGIEVVNKKEDESEVDNTIILSEQIKEDVKKI